MVFGLPKRIVRLGLMFFFFSSRRRHTRCSRDWSSDVCSSDLRCRVLIADAGDLAAVEAIQVSDNVRTPITVTDYADANHRLCPRNQRVMQEIGRASCRERV